MEKIKMDKEIQRKIDEQDRKNSETYLLAANLLETTEEQTNRIDKLESEFRVLRDMFQTKMNTMDKPIVFSVQAVVGLLMLIHGGWTWSKLGEETGWGAVKARDFLYGHEPITTYDIFDLAKAFGCSSLFFLWADTVWQNRNPDDRIVTYQDINPYMDTEEKGYASRILKAEKEGTVPRDEIEKSS